MIGSGEKLKKKHLALIFDIAPYTTLFQKECYEYRTWDHLLIGPLFKKLIPSQNINTEL